MKQPKHQLFMSLSQRVPVPTRLIHAIRPAILACCLGTQAQAAEIPVPNGGFETLYKPGSTTITADTGVGWTQGAGPNAAMEGDVATYSDTTTGSAADISGWVNAPAAGTAPNGGWAPPYDWPKGSGVVTRLESTPYGSYYYAGNPTDWGNPFGAAIESAAPLALVASGLTYTISMSSNNLLSPTILDLLANGVILTPTSSVTAPDGLWTLHTNTYDAASLSGVVGESLKIRVGWALGANGSQGFLDNVRLSSAGAAGYGTWAAANAPGQPPGEDHDNDGVQNGIEYFMGQAGSSFTAMPGLDATNTISWPASAAYQGTYEVQTSPDLGPWTNVVPKPVPSGGTLSYLLPPGAPGGRSFVRLLVTPAP